MNDDEYQRALHKYREECIPHPLDFRPSLERLLDSHHCNEMAKIFNAHGRWEKMRAVATLGLSLPPKRGVYMFVWRPDLHFPFESGSPERIPWILYVGKAGRVAGDHDTIRHRYLHEYHAFVGGDVALLWNREPPRDREDRLKRYLCLRPLEYWFLLLDDPNDIYLLERKLIRMLAPPLNRQLAGPRLIPGRPKPAFEEPNEQ